MDLTTAKPVVFTLDAESFDAFLAELDREQRANPRLAKLMSERSVFEDAS